METSLPYQIDENSSTDSPNLPHDFTESPRQDDALLTTTKELRSILAATEEHLVELQQQKDELAKQNLDLVNVIVEIKAERDAIQREIEEVGESQDELVKKSDDESRERFEIQNKLDVSQERIEGFLRSLDLVGSVKECLIRVLKKMGKENSENVSEEGFVLDEKDELKKFLSQMMFVYKLASKTEEGFVKCEEMRRKEKRELENSVVSLTEENRDINSLLRIALVEKEAGEKAISRLKGNGEQKRVALLQIAERGLQKVGFGFMRSAPTGDSLDNLGSKSDSSECDEEVVSLASMVEKMMKNLRIEITQLRRSLEESRSDTEQLQNLAEKQTQKLAENATYIEELEERESMLTYNVEQLMIEIAGAEEEIVRWKEACELEVEAGKSLIEERDKEAMILREELGKTKASLDMLNSKLKLKEELAATAMFAQEASEKSLCLADRKASELRRRIEELTRQLEEADGRGERNRRRKVRHVCWPWRALRVNPSGGSTGTRSRNVRRMLPEMEALLLN